MITFELIPPVGPITTHKCQNADTYGIISGLIKQHLDLKDDPERVNVFWEGRYTDMFVGESSKLNDVSILNVRATAIYRNNVLTHEPDTEPNALPSISGPALLFNRPIWK